MVKEARVRATKRLAPGDAGPQTVSPSESTVLRSMSIPVSRSIRACTDSTGRAAGGGGRGGGLGQDLPAARELARPGAVGEEAEVADADEALGDYMAGTFTLGWLARETRWEAAWPTTYRR